jgi:hypothetical protein
MSGNTGCCFFCLIYKYMYWYMITVMVFNATFNNISVISWRSVLSVEKTGVPGENHRPFASNRQTASHNIVSNTPRLSGVRTHNISGDKGILHNYFFYCCNVKYHNSSFCSCNSNRNEETVYTSIPYLYIG